MKTIFILSILPILLIFNCLNAEAQSRGKGVRLIIYKRVNSGNRMLVHGQNIFGMDVNAKTGCLHYASPLDIVAIKFKCCNEYYACYFCHQQLAGHDALQWSKEEFSTKAILCGHCGFEISIHEYLSSESQCLNCKSSFNPKCKLHWKFYFERSIP